MKTKTCFFVAICLCFFASCSKPLYYALTINNNSQKNLWFSYSTKYPDTTIAMGYTNASVLPGQKLTTLTSIPYDPSHPYTGIVEIFLFDSDAIRGLPWDSVVSKNLILKRYDVNLDSTQHSGGIFYP